MILLQQLIIIIKTVYKEYSQEKKYLPEFSRKV